MYSTLFKPVIDFLAAFFGLLLLSPLFVIITLGLFIANQGKPFFFQTRPGKDEQLFRIVKFKTMNDKKDVTGDLLPDAQRLTKIGNFVRKTSLDEIPQLLNVLRGDMSLIGPRPLLTHYLHLYSDFQNRRHEVKPGITGWAQINYPYGASIEDARHKLEYDLYYAKNYTPFLDLLILLQTVRVVLWPDGAR